MAGERGRRSGIGSGAALALVPLLWGLGCGSSAQSPADAAVGLGSTDASSPTDASSSTDASSPGDLTGGSICSAAAAHPAPADLCSALPSGTLTACGHDGSGQPSPTGYLEIRGADGSRTYVCATSWSTGGSGGYWFNAPDQFMSDPQSCCGGNPTPTAAPTAPATAVGFLGSLNAPKDIKPQESAQPGAGSLVQNPFAVIVRDSSGGAAFATALATWLGWAGDGKAHPAPDGSGGYYFPGSVLINYAILETRDGQIVVVIGPEVSLTADGKSPLGHPTLGGCPAGGGAPLALMAGEVSGTTLTNHSGRFGHDASATPAALATAAALFNCLGIPITATTYYPAKP